MATPAVLTYPAALHPLHAIFLGAPFPLFLGGLLSDLAYRSTFQVQWINFASWLNAGAMIFAGVALVWAIIDFFREFTVTLVAAIVVSMLVSLTLTPALCSRFLSAHTAPETPSRFGAWLDRMHDRMLAAVIDSRLENRSASEFGRYAAQQPMMIEPRIDNTSVTKAR